LLRENSQECGSKDLTVANKQRIFGSAPWQSSGHWLSLPSPGLEWRDGSL